MEEPNIENKEMTEIPIIITQDDIVRIVYSNNILLHTLNKKMDDLLLIAKEEK